MPKRYKVKVYSKNEIVSYCKETYGADHRITKATISAHKRVSANQKQKTSATNQTTKKRVNNVVQFTAKRVSPFKQKLDPSNLEIVNLHRAVLGQKKFTKAEHKKWLMRFQATASATQIAA